ncbi:hypothetical protein Agabi119p4_8720 [Agaricus bisporus var. burnettii]|uniref:Protein YIP n=1 Tax=Agaricus bisporus var. burnettii TaxID=192524 RepID=A0A8H7C4H7_AGABI|nr:hypothetical protein Agabi119p4_8720 [Agaricus bisporus var. burnettii]
MAYVQVEADDRLEEGPERLQFKTFLPSNDPPNSAGVGNTDRGYLHDSPAHGKSGGGFWTVEYYQQYFDVDTQTVLKRCYTTLIPTQSRTYISTYLNPPDMYGPFWVLTTLIFTLFLSSSLAASISAYLSAEGTNYDYNFTLLSLAVSVVYAYGLALPILLWIALRYLGVGDWSIVEAMAVWGYAQFVWIPVSILCVIPEPITRWVLVGLATALSGWFLVANIYPVLASAEAKATRLIIIVLAILHLGLALTFKVLFFGYYVIGGEGDFPLPGMGGNATTTA